MKKIWTVAKHEYLSNLKRPAFLIAAFGIPIFIVVLMAVVFAITADESSNVESLGNIGYVDASGVLEQAIDQPENFVVYETAESAQEALDAGEVGAYAVIPSNYQLVGTVQVYSNENLPDGFQDVLDAYLLANLTAELESNIPIDRLIDPAEMDVVLEDSGRRISEEAVFALFLAPIIFVVVFMMSSTTTSQFLMSGVVEEKTNRIIEVLITSVSPMQLLMGKLLGLGALGLTQILIWLGLGLVVLTLGNQIPALSAVELPPDLIIIALIYFVLTYFLLASLMAGVGIVVGTEQEARQYVGILSVIFVIPFFFIIQLIEEPNGPLSVFLSLFPFTASITMILRASLGIVPIEQLLASIGILIATTILVTWASAKIFRWATLLYGKKATPRELWRVIRGSVDIGEVVQKEASA